MAVTALAFAFTASLALAAPTGVPAAAEHSAILDGGYAEVSYPAGDFNANLPVSIVILDADADFTDPEIDDVVFLNEYTTDAAGDLAFRFALPAGELDDYLLAVNVEGATERYIWSLDATVALPPTLPDPGTDPGTGPGTDPGTNPDTDPGSDLPDTPPSGAPISADSGPRDGELGATGAEAYLVPLAAVGAAALAAGTWLVIRRRRA